MDPIIQHYWLPTIRAAIAVNKKDPQLAISGLQEAMTYELGDEGYATLYPVFVRGMAYLALKQGEPAAAEFTKILQHRGIVRNAPLGALAQLQLARAQAMSGNLDGARKSYQDFLALWKNADPDLLPLKQAHAEYGKLSQ